MAILSTSDGIFALDRSLAIALWNPAMERITGIGRDEAAGRQVLDLLPFLKETGGEQHLAEVLAGGAPVSEAWRIPRTEAFFEARYFPLSKDGSAIQGAVCMVRDVTGRAQAEREGQRQQKHLRDLAARLEARRENERRRFAREIHDGLEQRLMVLDMELSRLENEISTGYPAAAVPTRARIRSMQQSIEAALDAAARIRVDLSPSVLDDLGLTEAIQWQAQEFQARTGIACAFARVAKGIALDPDRATAVFRIFQELLANVARHSGAKTVKVKLEKMGPNLILQVKDDGKGIREDQIASSDSLGLAAILEKARWLEGELAMRGIPGAGTTITLKLPLASAEALPRAANQGE